MQPVKFTIGRLEALPPCVGLWREQQVFAVANLKIFLCVGNVQRSFRHNEQFKVRQVEAGMLPRVRRGHKFSGQIVGHDLSGGEKTGFHSFSFLLHHSSAYIFDYFLLMLLSEK